MLIFWEQRLVFLATPKAGSTAIEVALEPLASLAVQRPPEMKHVDAARFHRHIHPWLRDMTDDAFTTVALMREPLDWLRSWYRFHLRDAVSVPETGFEGFAQRYLAAPETVTRGIRSQTAFFGSGPLQVDRLFRYEDMDAFTHFLDEWLGCAVSLPRINVPPAADVTLSPATETALRDMLAPDFALHARLG